MYTKIIISYVYFHITYFHITYMIVYARACLNSTSRSPNKYKHIMIYHDII